MNSWTRTFATLMIAMAAATAASAQTEGILPPRSFAGVPFESDLGHVRVMSEAAVGSTGIVLEYDTATYVLSWPDHRSHQRTFWLKNTGASRINGIYYRINGNTNNFLYGGGLTGLNPGERIQVPYFISWRAMFPGGGCEECFWNLAGQEVAQTWSVTAFQCEALGPDGTCTVTAPTVTVNQSIKLSVQTPNTDGVPAALQRPKSGTVTGRVSDAITGASITTAQVEVLDPNGNARLAPFNLMTVLTDQGVPGVYTIAVPAMTAMIKCAAPGYQTYYNVKTVAAGQTVTSDCPMNRMRWSASYTLKQQVAGGPGLWGWARSPDGTRAIMTPALSFSITPANATATMINLTTGTMAWQHVIGGRSIGPSFSPDGTRVALPIESDGDPALMRLRILNAATGAEVLTLTTPTAFNPMSTAYSPDGGYLVVGGSGGEVWLLETTGYTTVWQKRFQAQMRAVAWSPDSQTIYASGDPSPIYALKRSDGSENWRSYTTSFAYQDAISLTSSGNRIAVQAKYGGFVILDSAGNDIFRQGARDGGGHSALAAPDGSYFVSSNGNLNGAHVLDPTGKLFWWSNSTSEGVALSGDRRFMLAGAALYEIGGTLLWSNATAEAAGPHIAIMSPDMHYLVVGTESGGIYIFEGSVTTPAPCTYDLGSTSASFTPAAASGSFTVNVSASDCVWNASSSESWVTVTSGAPGTGTGSLNYAVAANTTGSARSATITAGGKVFTVNQSGASTGSSSDERIAVGLGQQSSGGGWIQTRTGTAGAVAPATWINLPWASYNASGGLLRVAAGDVDGDGLDEIVAGVGAGGSGWMAVFDDAAHGHALLRWIQVPWAAYNTGNGEVWPAVGDLDGDGRAEIVAGLGSGGAGWFAIFDDAAGSYAMLGWRQVLWGTYNALSTAATHPAIANVDGTGASEIVVGLGAGGDGYLEVFDGSAGGYAHRAWLRVPWASYNTANGATFPAAGDLDGDGRAEIVAGLGPGGAGWLAVFDDAPAAYAHLRWLRPNWAAYNDSSSGETHPAVGNIDDDARAEIVIGLDVMSGAGGWFELLDDSAASFMSLGWRRVDWAPFIAAGGATFPAIGRLR